MGSRPGFDRCNEPSNTQLATGLDVEHETGQGLIALGLSVSIVGIALGVILMAAAILAAHRPGVRAVYKPLNLLILIAQLMDGATTWVGVENPFGLAIPRYTETVALSAFLLDTLGGFPYFLIKVALGLVVIAAIEMAWRGAKKATERQATVVAQVALVVIGMIPVYNNVGNFVAAA